MKPVLILALFFLFVPVVAEVPKQTANYEIVSDVIVNGGVTSSGGPYELRDLVGQPSTGFSARGAYTLSSGHLTPLKLEVLPGESFVVY